MLKVFRSCRKSVALGFFSVSERLEPRNCTTPIGKERWSGTRMLFHSGSVRS